MATVQAHAQADQRFVIRGLEWREYEAILQILGDRPIRTTYDRGDLELMSPSFTHEYYKCLFDRFLTVLSIELDIPLASGGSTTFKREELERGLEPDSCFWVEHEPAIRGKTAIDLGIDPPPDLAIEIDISRSSLDRQGVYAALGVPELWRFDGQSLRVYRLQADGTYAISDRSLCFPFLELAEVARFLLQGTHEGQTRWSRSVRDWVNEEVRPRYEPPVDQ